MKRIAVIVSTLLATATMYTCVDRQDARIERRRAEEDAMATDSAVENSIVDLERAALEQFGRGDIDGPIALCDEAVSYFDPHVERRIDDRAALAALYEEARGTRQYESCDLIDPRVQPYGDTAILTYVLVTASAPDAGSTPTRWKVTTVYHRFDAGWHVVHSHFAIFADTAPREFELTSPPVGVGRLEGTLAELLGLEDAAMERWRRGDPWGFWELSAPGVSYFDPETPGRVDGTDGLRRLYAAVEGKIRYDISEYVAPRVQVFGDVAVLSYQYRSAETDRDGFVSSVTRWNTTEVFAKIDGRWRIVHTHWSYARAGARELAPPN